MISKRQISNTLTRDDTPFDASIFAFPLRDLNALLLVFGTTCCDVRCFRLVADAVTFDDVVADSLVILLVVRPSTPMLFSAASGC